MVGCKVVCVTSAGILEGVTTNHSIASVFLTFLLSQGPVYVNGQDVTQAIFDPLFYVTGYPIAEAYWANVRIAGTLRSVLIQCFERRCLTYTPGNPPEWQVEAGNVGSHYYAWRYGELGNPPTDAPTPSTGDVRVVAILFDPPGSEGQEETVTLENHADTAVQLEGWRIEDSSGTVYYTFPSFELPVGATVVVHACNGTNSATLLYNGRCSATWNNSGDTAYLYDAGGGLVSTFGY